MATAKPDPAGQEQPRAPSVPGTRNLDTLQNMLNLVFLTSGRFVKEYQAGGGTGRMKLNMQQKVPVATERFHDALDELENEIHQAQTVLRRDLALMKQDRRKREAAVKQQEVEKARLAAESRQAVPIKKPDAPVKAEPVTPAHVEVPATNNQPAKPVEPEKTLEREEESMPPPTSTTSAAPADPSIDASVVAHPSETEFDFDAIFGDEMDTTGDNNNNKNHNNNDTNKINNNDNTNNTNNMNNNNNTTISNNNQEDVNMDTSGDLNFNLDEGPSLLRGLEDFAKSNDDDNTGPGPGTNTDMDVAMPDLPDLNTNTNISSKNTASENIPSGPPTTTIKPVEQPVTQPTTNTDLLVADNLDDLFNMDEYEHPENSSFNDAFFDFDT